MYILPASWLITACWAGGDSGVDLTLRCETVVRAIRAAVFVSLAAESTPFGIAGEAFGLIELLFTGGKGKAGSAVRTLNGFFLKSHWMSPLLII
jgi:hypothetical protein